jgi:hypothetical protein
MGRPSGPIHWTLPPALALGAVLWASGRPPAADAAAPRPADGERLARRLCVGCHAFTPPDALPRSAWRAEIEKMAIIVEGRGIPGWGEARDGVRLSPDYQAILAYYERAAPASLPAPAAWPLPAEPARFVRRSIGFDAALTPEPAVANVRLADLDGDGRPELLACDMRQGLVLLARPADPGGGAIPVAQVPHPAHVSTMDLDGDGRLDLLVADLGEFFPGDHEKGAVTLLRARAGGGFTPFTLGGFPRVADAEAADVDADGRPDLLVAAFGWHRKGGLWLLRNGTRDWTAPSFERAALDARPGAIHVVPADVDRDGRLDLVALIAQEHEQVVAYLGDGKGGFKPRPLYAAPHPNWGSSGIQVVDLDRDGDLDVLASNGDMFDDDILKPYHGVQWLENRGGLRFTPHALASLAGAHRAVAADLDGDGDLDVAAAAFTGAVAGEAASRLPALVWLEQVRAGVFERRTIAVGSPVYATLDAGDVDADGDVDLVTGVFRLHGASDHWLEVWLNQGKAGPAR